MNGRWQIEVSHDAHWLLTPAVLGSKDLAKGRWIPPHIAAAMLDDWFPEGPHEPLRAALLGDIALAIDPAIEGRGPLSIGRMKALLREALADGRLVAVRIRATTSAGRRLELDLPDEPKPLEEVTHWVEFDVTDQKGNLVSGLDFKLLLVGKGPEDGKLAEGNVYRTGVKKGSHRLLVKTLLRAAWGDPAATKVEEGKEVGLVADVTGFAEKTPAELKIHDAKNLTGEAIATVAGEVASGERQIKAKWTPSREDLMKAKSGEVVFVASVTGGAFLRAVSAAVPAKVKHEIAVKNQKGNAPDNTAVTGRFVDGSILQGATNGGKVEVWGPAGQAIAWVGLPGKLGIATKFKREDGEERKFVTPERAKQ